MKRRPVHRGLTMLEISISLVLIVLLLSILVPTLSKARLTSYRDQSQANLRIMAEACAAYLKENDRAFPFVALQPGWHYAGMRFSPVENSAFPDYDRPLNRYLPLQRTDQPEQSMCCSPADQGIVDPNVASNVQRRTAFRAYGTSYRANAAFFDLRLARRRPGVEAEPRGMKQSEITTPPSRLVVMGEPAWYEASEETGRHADWYGLPNTGNVLFFDGRVEFRAFKPRRIIDQTLFEPIMPEPESAAASRPEAAGSD